MKTISEDLFNKLERVSAKVCEEFRRKGVIIPIENMDKSIALGAYTIVKQHLGRYSIYNKSMEIVVDHINLPQTAVLIANGLALGQILNECLLTQDRKYGYSVFDEELHKRALKLSNEKSLEYFDVRMSKYMIAKAKKEYYKTEITKSFLKLRSIK